MKRRDFLVGLLATPLAAVAARKLVSDDPNAAALRDYNARDAAVTSQYLADHQLPPPRVGIDILGIYTYECTPARDGGRWHTYRYENGRMFIHEPRNGWEWRTLPDGSQRLCARSA